MIIDKNNFQQTGTVKEIMNTDSLGNKWESFGWDVSEIDGHDINDIEKFLIILSSKPKITWLIQSKVREFHFQKIITIGITQF